MITQALKNIRTYLAMTTIQAIPEASTEILPFQADAESAARIAPATTFSKFSALPCELRLLIWLEAFSHQTPRAYTFWLDIYRDRQSPADVGEVQLVPGEFGHFRSGPQRLAAFTLHDRSVAASCAEAREVFLKIHPDTLQFRPRSYRTRRTFRTPYETLRFNADRDIIILSEAIEWQRRQLLQWLGATTEVETPMHHILLTVRNLGIDTYTMLRYRYFSGQALPLSPHTCNCDRTKDYCVMGNADPLTDFLAQFPALQTLHLVCSDNVLIREEVGEPMPIAPVPLQAAPPFFPLCLCPPNAEDGGNEGKPVHDWPAIPAMDTDHDWFISYPERGPCAIPELRQLARVRKRFHRQWPYYQEYVDNPRFDIRILKGVVKTPLARRVRMPFQWPAREQQQLN